MTSMTRSSHYRNKNSDHAGDAKGRASKTLAQNKKSGMKVYLVTVVAAFSVLWEIFICGENTGQYVWQPADPDNLTKQKTRIDYPEQLCGRWWLGRLRIIKFAFLILKYLGSDHNKDSCEVPENPEEYFPLQSTSSEKASLSLSSEKQ